MFINRINVSFIPPKYFGFYGSWLAPFNCAPFYYEAQEDSE